MQIYLQVTQSRRIFDFTTTKNSMEKDLAITDDSQESTLRPGEKRIPGFARYAVDRDGNVRNIMTGTVIIVDAEKGKRRLFNDEGSRKWVDVTETFLSELFAPPAPVETIEDKFTKEIVPSDSPIIEQTYNVVENADGSRTEQFGFKMDGGNIHPANKSTGIVVFATKAKNTKKGLSDQDIRDLRQAIENKSLTFKTAGEKYGINLEHARRIYKRQYYPDVV